MLSVVFSTLLVASPAGSQPAVSLGIGLSWYPGIDLNTSMWLSDYATVDVVAGVGLLGWEARGALTLRLAAGGSQNGGAAILETSAGVLWARTICFPPLFSDDASSSPCGGYVGPYPKAGLALGYGYLGELLEVRLAAGAVAIFADGKAVFAPAVRVTVGVVLR